MKQTQPQVVELKEALEREAHRVARWGIFCLIFALATPALAIGSKSFVFVVVALFSWFFVWNRWRLWRFLIACLPPPNEDQDAWLERTVEGLGAPPAWYRVSEYVAAVTFLICFGIITVVVAYTGGTSIRFLYAACWLLIGIVLVLDRIARRNQTRRRRQGTSPQPISRQPIPQVTADDVERVARRDFSADEYAIVMATLSEYRTEKWHGEHARVQLAALKVANGSVPKLRACIELAKSDYRDALAAAEYPGYCRIGFQVRKLPAEEQSRIINSDWRQYQEWLKR